MLYINSFINSYGVVAAAATAVGNKVILVITICTTAMVTAGNSIVAQSFAAKKFRRVSETLLWILVVSCIFSAILSVLMLLFPETIFSFFDKDPEVLAMSHMYAPIAVISFFGFATRAAGFAFINGIGFSKFSFAAGITDGIILRIGLSLLFGIVMGMGIRGFWLGHALAGHAIGVLALIYYLTGKWKNRKLLV